MATSQYIQYPRAGSGGGGSGTVTSVSLVDSTGLFVVTGSPVTTTGTITLSAFSNQSANRIFAGPASGGAAPPTFRALVAADLPVGTIVTIGALDSQTANANGLAIVAGVLSTQSADATHPGVVNNTTQTFSGNKTISGTLAVANSSTAAFTINSTSVVVDATNNAIGIGAAPATTAVVDAVNNTVTNKAYQITSYGSNAGYRTFRATGTLASPTASVANDILGFYSSRGYGATGFGAASTGALNFVAQETFTDSSMKTDMVAMVTPTGSVTAAEAFRVSSTGVTLGPQSASTAVHTINGGQVETTRTITGNLTLDTTTSDYIVFVRTLSGAISITLPTPVNGRVFVFKDSEGNAGTNNITIIPHGAEKIEGLAANKVFQTNWGAWKFVSNGTDWFMV